MQKIEDIDAGFWPSVEDQTSGDHYRHRDRDHDKRKKTRRRERRRSSSSSEDRHSKDRRHKKKRHRRQSSSRSRSRSSSRTRNRSCDKRRRYKKRHRTRSRSRSSDSKDSVDSWDRNEHKQDAYKHQVPNNTVMVRGLAPHISENDIRQDLLKNGILVKDIRLIRHRDTGNSRGFAFSEFHTVADAKKWMDVKKGSLVFKDGSEANLIYSMSKSGMSDSAGPTTDWYCSKCRAYNFKRRELCYKCNEPKPLDADTELSCEISSTPTTTLMLFELDALTTEEGVLQAFKNDANLASMPIRSVRIPREPATKLSQRVCYVESNNVTDSIRLLAAFGESNLEIDGVNVQAVYHKPTAPVIKNNAAATALAAAQWTNNSGGVEFVPPPEPDEEDTEKLAEYSASLYAKTEAEYSSYLVYYREYYRKKSETDKKATSIPIGTTSRTCSSDVQSIPNVALKKEIQVTASAHHSDGRTEPSIAVAPKNPPDSSQFTYDEASGYYFDRTSGYYYDPTNQYYYDSSTHQFLQWDQAQQKYVITGQNSGIAPTATPEPLTETKSSNKKPKPQEKDPKNVAKEMEKWAKGLNQRREYYREPETFSKWTKFDSPVHDSKVENTPTPQTSKSAAYDPEEGSSDDQGDLPFTPAAADDDNDLNSGAPDLRFLDKQKIACLLCKRQFSSMDVLLKHAKMSELHKQNLAEVLGVQQQDEAVTAAPNSSKAYRDRAKERRMKFGSEASSTSNSLKDLYMKAKEDIVTTYVEEPTKQGIKEDNIGNKMLQKMGWQAGQGLGRDNKGIKDPITAERRFGKFGLGSDVPGALDIDDKDDRQTKARKLTIARYLKLD